MQKRINTYFTPLRLPSYDEKHKKCFVYDPTNRRAYFCTKPEPTDKFIVSKLNIKLFYRKPETTTVINIPIIECAYSVPLIKSNLQKAVRRCENRIAIQSALALIQVAPIELLRRLPIIYIEDVCLMDSYSIVVWLMMADNNYQKLTNMDIDIIVNIVNSLCNCNTYFNYVKTDYNYEYTHETLEFSDELLSLYYRSQYGGMTGDLQMLKVAIDYYIKNPLEIVRTQYNNIDYSSINKEFEILNEAIDFHCYPNMLYTLNKLTYINKETIKMCIWFAKSGYNVRKPETQVLAQEYQKKPEWKKIEKHLDEVRRSLIT